MNNVTMSAGRTTTEQHPPVENQAGENSTQNDTMSAGRTVTEQHPPVDNQASENSTQNDTMSASRTATEQHPPVDNQASENSTQNDTNSRQVANVIYKRKKTPMTPTPLEYSWWSTYPIATAVGIFVLFITIVIIAGILTVCFTQRKQPDKKCELTFTLSIENANVYDSNPRQVVVGDFNKDKHLNLVVANSGADCVGIFMGYGNGIFTDQITYSTGFGSRPYSVAVGDFNDDNELDIIVANYGINSVGVFLGDSNGSFADPIVTSLDSSRPIAVVVADFNNDSVLDIAVANNGTLTVAILLGTNNGSFGVHETYFMGFDSIPYAIAVVDVNKDDILDLAVVNYGTSELIIVLRNENGSSATHRYSTGSGSHPVSLGVNDLDNDNTLDIVVANSGASNIKIFLGYDDGRFTNQMTFSTGSTSFPQSLVISDFSNDTQLDIAVADSSKNNLLVLKGHGNGSFSLITTHSTGYNSDPCSVTVGDFDKDNIPDIAVANKDTNNILALTSFHIYPTLTQVKYSAGRNAGPWSVCVSDLNHDNYLDVIVANNRGDNVGVFMNLGNRTFRDQQTFYMGNGTQPYFVAIGDFNNDNQSDMVVVLQSARKVAILLGYNDGTFRAGDIYSIRNDSRPYTANVGDFNSDENLDFVIAHYDVGNVVIFFGSGDGTFTNRTSLLADGDIHSKCAGVADLNNDNILDIAASDADSGGITIFLGYRNGSFRSPIVISTAYDHLNAFTIGDVNGDDQLDIVYSDNFFAHLGVLLGRGDGTFGNLTQYMTVHGSDPWYISLGYYNDDALVDIAINLSYDSSVFIYLGIGNGLLGTPTRLSTGQNSVPWSVMFADFDNDHQQDLVVANDNQQDIIINDDQDSNIMVFFVRNDYADFQNETSRTTGSLQHPSSIVVTDLDNDGQTDDVIVANSGNDTIELLRNYKKGIFVNRTFFSTDNASHPQCINVADFNNDHLLDISVVNAWGNSMDVFLGLGNESLQTKSVYSTESAPSSIAAGDFNRDGRMDIVTANEGADNVAVFLAQDYVMFTNNITYVTGVLPRGTYVSASDFNNDGRLDIAIINTNFRDPAIYLGYGNGTFSEQITNSISAKSTPISSAVGDFNNDSYIDIVVANKNAETIGVLLGYGNGSFRSQITYSTGNLSQPYSVTTGDFNGDSRLDIVVANTMSDNIGMFLGFGNGSFAEQIVYAMPTGSWPVWVTVHDLNNDTFLDISVANAHADNICILFGYGNGSFGNIITLPTGLNSQPFSIDIGDLNNDQFLDIVVGGLTSNNVGIFFGYGNGTFSSQKTLSTNSDSNLYSIVVRDINNDTKLDILAADFLPSNSSIGIFYGYGDGNFTLPKIYPTDSITLSTSIVTGDFNNDSRIDLVVTHYFQGSFSVMLQLRFDPFSSSELLSTGNSSRPKSIAVGDVNNDDQPDILVANSGTNNVGVFLGYGNGKFSNQLTYGTGSDSVPSSLVAGDFNHDHYLDIAVVNSATGNLGILLGNGSETFANIFTYSTGFSSNPSCVAVNDLNGDSHLDLVVANSGFSSVLVFLGTGNGTFLQQIPYSLGYAVHPQSVAIGDVNNDNKLDIVVASDSPNYIQILLQTC